MKKEKSTILPTLLMTMAIMIFLSGCSSQYQMTLIGNRHVTTFSKPKLNTETQYFEFKDHEGKIREIPKSRVLKIEPFDSGSAPRDAYIPQIQ